MLTDHSRAVIAVNTAFPILSVLFVSLRFFARRIKKTTLKADDYTILLGLVFTIAQSVPFAYCGAKGGMGQHIETLTKEEAVIFGKVTFYTQIPYVLAVSTIKISILLFYRSIFTTRKFRLAVHIFLGAVVAWTCAFLFATIFQAWPISYNWNQHQPGKTIDEVAMYQALACSELAFNVITLSMPWFVVWKLQIGTTQKWAICGIFALGGLVCVITAVRIYYFTTVVLSPETDFTYDTYNVFIWTAIEPCVGVICACLPVLGPLFQGRSPESLLATIRSYVRFGSRDATSAGSSRPSIGSSANSDPKLDKQNEFYDIGFVAKGDAATGFTARVERSTAGDEENLNGRKQGVHVSSSFHTTYERR